MSLVDDGLISLSRKVSYYLPEFFGADRDAVLVKDLFTHTSGLTSPNYNAILNARLLLPGGSHRPVSAEDFLAAALETSLTTLPGSMCQYAGVNYLLLGEIVARRTGKTFEDAAKERILAPLGMEDSGFGLTSDMIPKWVQVDPGIFKDVDPPYDPPMIRTISPNCGSHIQAGTFFQRLTIWRRSARCFSTRDNTGANACSAPPRQYAFAKIASTVVGLPVTMHVPSVPL